MDEKNLQNAENGVQQPNAAPEQVTAAAAEAEEVKANTEPAEARGKNRKG